MTPKPDASTLFHALSDETRLEIIRLLSHGERCVCEITSALDAAQSRLSFHLKVLKDAGIVRDRKAGRWVHYALNVTAFTDIQRELEILRPKAVEKAQECCA